jgi:hypothetical protein
MENFYTFFATQGKFLYFFAPHGKFLYFFFTPQGKKTFILFSRFFPLFGQLKRESGKNGKKKAGKRETATTLDCTLSNNQRSKRSDRILDAATVQFGTDQAGNVTDLCTPFFCYLQKLSNKENENSQKKEGRYYIILKQKTIAKHIKCLQNLN